VTTMDIAAPRWRFAVERMPSLLVAATVLLVVPPSGVQDVSTSGHVTPADLAAVAVILTMAVRLLRGERAVGSLGWIPFAGAIVAFALTSITADDITTSVLGFARYAELFVLIPVAVAMSLRDRLDIMLVAGTLVAVSAAEAAVGSYQYLTRTGASFAGQYVRAVGTFGGDQVEALGALLGYGIVVTLALGLSLRGRPRVLLVCLAAILVVPLGLTLSRGAWLATAPAVLLVLLLFDWRAALAVVGAVGIAVALMSLQSGPAGGSASVGNRLSSVFSTSGSPDQSVKDRYALWSAAGAMWADHPVLGVGMKDFPRYRDRYAPASLSAGSDVDTRATGFRREPLLSPHNQYLLVAAEQGTVGALAFAGLFGALGVSSLRRRRRRAETGVEHRLLDLAAPGIVLWTLIDFMYGDVGAGALSVLLGVLLGIVARRMLIRPEVAR
jgi:O-antigen ligase